MKQKAIDIRRDFYTMATSDGTSAEITMYGDIVESVPVDFWTGEPLEGSYIILSEFLEDLEKIAGCKEITIRMNSYGGDAVVSDVIHNRLRELARNGANLICIVDGVAMSGGSLIMCACDTVKVNPSSLIMIHKAWCFLFGGYNADELREAATRSDAYDKMQVSIYKRKTGLSETVLMHMMSDATYMTGKEAIEKGFADELLEDSEPLNIAASADGKSLFVRGREMHLAPGMFAPDTIPTIKTAGNAVDDKIITKANAEEGGEKPMFNTVEELRAAYPELIEQIEAEAKEKASAQKTVLVDEAVQAERQRMQEIDEVAVLFDNALVQEAKYGEQACSAKELSYRAAQAAAKNGHKFLADLNADAEASGTSEVEASPGKEETEEEKTPEQKMAQARSAIGSLFKKKED